MPVIPRLQESNRLQVSSPVPIASTGQDRMAGEAIAGFGRAVQEAGETVSNFMGARKRATEAAERDRIKAEARAAAIEHLSNAEKNGLADGSDFKQLFTDGYDATTENMLGTIKDEELRAKARTEVLEVRNSYLETKVLGEVNRRSIQDLNLKTEKTTNLRRAIAWKEPHTVDKLIAEHNLSMDQMGAAGLYSADELAKIRRKGEEDIALSAVTGHMDRKEFSKASELAGKFAASLDEDQAQKIQSTIFDKEIQYKDYLIKAGDRRDKAAEHKARVTQDNTFAALYAKVSDPDLDPVERENIFNKDIPRLIKIGALRPSHSDTLQVEFRERGRANEDDIANDIYQISLDDPQEAQRMFEQSVAKGELGRTSGIQVQKFINDKLNGKYDPATKRQIKAAEDMIKGAAKKSAMFNRNPGPIQANMWREYSEAVSLGVPHAEAAQQAITKNIPQSGDVVIGGQMVRQMTSKDLVDAKKTAERDFEKSKKKTADKERLEKRLRAIGNREMALGSGKEE